MSSFSISPAVSGKSTWNLQTDGPLDLSTSGTWTIVPTVIIDVSAKVWGAGGGWCWGNGGGGGAATGNIALVSGTSYQLIVGSGGAGTSSPGRNGAGGGAGSGIQFTTGTVAILVAGGGGGGAGGGSGGGGGGTSGQAANGAQGPGQGATQSAPGAGGAGGRRTGASGSGRNGGNGAGDSASLAGGTGFGNGGTGLFHGGDAGGGGGGGGYYGGGGGGGDAGGGAGGAGSGYINTSVVTGGNLYAGNYEVPGLNSDTNRGTAGAAGITTSVNGGTGKIYLSLNIPPDGFNNVPASVTSGTTITINLGSTANSTATPPGTVSYTITGVSSDDLMGTPLTGNMTLAGYTYTLSIPTKIKASTTNTLTITAAGYTTSVTINPGLTVRYMVIAGGGGGGSDMGGGGGAGGYLAGTGYVVTPGNNVITVGAGGSGAPAGTSGPRGTNGQNTTALGFTAIGGGGGASKHDANSFPAGDGGSGGGGSGARQSNGSYGGLPGVGTVGQGNNGAASGVTWYPGGGGGSGAAASQTGSQVAHGGIGTQNDITGTNLYWAAGGGGAGYSVFGGNGGLGGGGGGAPRQSGGTGNGGGSALNAGADAEIGTTVAQTNKKGGAAGANTGSGGGGGAHYNLTNDGGNGGSGIVVIRYPGTPKATGGTITTAGTDTVHTFLSSGTFFAYTPGLSASQSSAYWGDSITFTSYTDDADNTSLAYTITGVTSSEINNAATSGNITVTSSVATLTVQLSNLNYTNIATMVVTVGTSSISIPVTYVTSLVASGTGMSWGLSRTITVSTRGLANASNIAYSMTGATTAQLAGGALSGNIQVVETPQITSVGQYSVYFDGTGDYLTVPANAAFDFGTGDYTIEGWLNVSTTSWSLYATGGSGSQDQFVCDAGTLYWAYGSFNAGAGVTGYYTSSDLNTWTHVAVARSSGTTKIFKNGIVIATASQAGSIGSSANTLQIGRRSDGFYHTTGFMSNIRVLKGTALYTANFTPPTSGLTAITNTSLLTCRSSTFRDLSTNNFTITKVGDAAVNVLNPVPTTFSNFFDGNGDFLSWSGSTAMNFSSSNFTIEAWIYLNAMPTADSWPTNWSSHMLIVTVGSPNLGDGNGFMVGSARLAWQSNDTAYWSSNHNMTTGQWYHVAVCRSSNTLSFFLNGTALGTSSFSGTAGTGSTTYVGSETGQGAWFNGFISNLRVVNGTALYTTAFTPSTTSLTAVTNTSLLTCQSNTLKDNSTNNFTITKNGDVAIRSFNPIEFTYSNLFDGTGDYLQVGSTVGPLTWLTTAGGTGTIEAWVYPTSNRAGNQVYTHPCILGIGGTYMNFGIANGTPRFYWWTGALNTFDSNTTVTLNAWNHLAIVFSGAGSNNLRMYLNGVLVGTTTFTNIAWASASGGDNVYVGVEASNAATSAFLGYISNLRVVNGTAIYTAAFTPPTTTAPAVSGTTLLTCTSNRFRDLSTNSYAITRTGDVKVEALIPDIAFVPAVSSPIGTAVLTINTNASEPILNTATLVVTISGTTRTFLLKTLGPGNIIERLNTTVSTIEFIDTEISDVQTANLEGKVLTSANFTAILNNAGFNTTVTAIEFIDTEVTDVHSANLEGKVLTQSTFNAEYEESTYKSTHGNVVYAATYAHTTGTDVRISGGGTAGSNQRWSI